jgi:Outer membrane protein beta-barrel domain
MDTTGFYYLDDAIRRGGGVMFKELVGAVVLCAAIGSPAAAQGAGEGRWSVSFGAGTAPSINGLYHEGGSGTVLGLPTAVEERDWADVYNAGFAMRADVGYALTPRLEVIGAFRLSRQDAEELSVGAVAGLDLRSQFADVREWGLEGGVRWHFAREARVDPYIGASAGVRWIDAMPATFSVPAAGVVLSDTPFYDDSTVPTVGGDVGVAFAIAPRVRLGVEAGLRWSGDLSDLDQGLAGTGLENLNDSSGRWTFPVMGTIGVRF